MLSRGTHGEAKREEVLPAKASSERRRTDHSQKNDKKGSKIQSGNGMERPIVTGIVRQALQFPQPPDGNEQDPKNNIEG